MPQLGETVTEGTVTRWLKQVGDHVEVDEPLLDVSTDKVDTEVPSAFGGRLAQILVAEGATVPIGVALCVIGEDDPTATDTGTETAGSDAVSERHAVRARLVGHQSRLSASPPAIVPPSPSGISRSAPLQTSPNPQASPTLLPNLANLPVLDRQPFTTPRRRTAAHLRSSLLTAAHTLTTTRVDYTSIDRIRRGTGLSFLPFIADTTCRALREFPRMNASVGDDELVLWAPINLGIAVDLDHDGLVVPVVHGADDLRLRSLGDTIRTLSQDARANQLGADAFAGGTFTITNAGGYGTVITGPVINTPQVAILSVDGISPAPVAIADADDWAVAVRVVGNLSLSFDHRAIDGAYATAFLARVRDLLESIDWPSELGS